MTIIQFTHLAVAGKALEVASREREAAKDRLMRAAEKEADIASREKIAAADRASRSRQSHLDRESRHS